MKLTRPKLLIILISLASALPQKPGFGLNYEADAISAPKVESIPNSCAD